jgi:hypothetical protein
MAIMRRVTRDRKAAAQAKAVSLISAPNPSAAKKETVCSIQRWRGVGSAGADDKMTKRRECGQTTPPIPVTAARAYHSPGLVT